MTKPKYGITTRLPFWERLWTHVSMEPNSGCWLWTGSASGHRYGTIFYEGKAWKVHRLTYELFVGPIPEEKEIDHKCRVTFCCNPNHLEPVMHKENVCRGDRLKVEGHVRPMKAHCKHGHPWIPENIYINPNGNRQCHPCSLAASKKSHRRIVEMMRNGK